MNILQLFNILDKSSRISVVSVDLYVKRSNCSGEACLSIGSIGFIEDPQDAIIIIYPTISFI